MHGCVLVVCVLDGPGTDGALVFVVPGAHLSPHHAAAGPDAAVSPVVSSALPALAEPQQPPRSAPPAATANQERWDASKLDF